MNSASEIALAQRNGAEAQIKEYIGCPFTCKKFQEHFCGKIIAGVFHNGSWVKNGIMAILRHGHHNLDVITYGSVSNVYNSGIHIV